LRGDLQLDAEVDQEVGEVVLHRQGHGAGA
jgi:hypothetical protein